MDDPEVTIEGGGVLEKGGLPSLKTNMTLENPHFQLEIHLQMVGIHRKKITLPET